MSKVEKVNNEIKAELIKLKEKYDFINGWSNNIVNGEITIYVEKPIFRLLEEGKIKEKKLVLSSGKEYKINWKYIGRVYALSFLAKGKKVKRRGKKKTIDRTAILRPFPMGVSIGHKDITAGTAGLVVLKDGKEYILSNNHVFANSNKGEKGDPILQCGPYDLEAKGIKGEEQLKYKVGELYDFVPISIVESKCFAGYILIKLYMLIGRIIKFIYNLLAKILGRKTRLKLMDKPMYAVLSTNYVNLVDCALMEPDKKSLYEKEILEIGIPKGEDEVKLGDIVMKSGRTSGYTEAKVTDTNARIEVWYEEGFAIFENQIIFESIDGRPVAQGGDSGSALLKKSNKKVVGLLFAGSEDGKVGIGNHYKFIKEALKCDVYYE